MKFDEYQGLFELVTGQLRYRNYISYYIIERI